MASVARITTISSRSDVSFEDAVKQGIARANQTLHGVEGAWVKDHVVNIKEGTISSWQVTLEVTFVLDDAGAAVDASSD
jgi:dodecin